MSKIFTKGNNVVNQLGCSRKVKETFWKQVMLPADSGKILKIDANPGQTAVLTDTGMLQDLTDRRHLVVGMGTQLPNHDQGHERLQEVPLADSTVLVQQLPEENAADADNQASR